MSEAMQVDEAIQMLKRNLALSVAPANFPPIERILGESGDEKAFDALVYGLRNGGDYIRSASALGLGYFGNREATQYLIHTLQNDSGVYVRCDAALALGELKAEDTLPVLLQAFPKESFEVQKRIVLAISKIGTVKAFDALHAVLGLLAGPDFHERTKAVLDQMVRRAIQQLRT